MRENAQRTRPVLRATSGAVSRGGSRLMSPILLRASRRPISPGSELARENFAQRLLIDVPARDADPDRLAGKRVAQLEEPGEAGRARALGQVVRRAQEDANGVGDGALARLDESRQPLEQGAEGQLVGVPGSEPVCKRVGD